MNNASFLLSSACAAFKNAALALNGPLERDVEASAAKCWDLRERSVQVIVKCRYCNFPLIHCILCIGYLNSQFL